MLCYCDTVWLLEQYDCLSSFKLVYTAMKVNDSLLVDIECDEM